MASLSAGGLAVEGFRLLNRERGAALAWAGCYLALMVITVGLIVGVVGSQAAAFLQPGVGQMAPQAALALMKPLFGLYALMLPLGLLCQAVLMGAIYRAVLRPTERGFFFLRIGADEFRLLGACLILYLIVIAGVVIVGGVAAALVAAAPGAATGVLAGILWIVGMPCFFAWIGVRLCLSTPMTFAQRRLRIFGSIPLTRGHYWPLFWAFIIALILAVVVSMVMQAILGAAQQLSGDSLTALVQGGRFTPATLTALAPIGVLYTVLFAIAGLVQAVVMLAPLAAAYRAIVPGASADATAETFA